MEEWKVSALPVLEGEGRVVGVVSEADLLPKEEFRDSDPDRYTQLRRLSDLAKAGAVTAGELMTAPALTVHANATLAQAARTMAHAQGQAAARRRRRGHAGGHRQPRRPAEGVPARGRGDRGGGPPGGGGLPLPRRRASRTGEVREGVVTLGGRIRDPSLVPAAARLIRAVEGVVDFDSQLTTAHLTPGHRPETTAGSTTGQVHHRSAQAVMAGARLRCGGASSGGRPRPTPAPMHAPGRGPAATAPPRGPPATPGTPVPRRRTGQRGPGRRLPLGGRVGGRDGRDHRSRPWWPYRPACPRRPVPCRCARRRRARVHRTLARTRAVSVPSAAGSRGGRVLHQHRGHPVPVRTLLPQGGSTASPVATPAAGPPTAITRPVTRTTQASTTSERRLRGLRRHRHNHRPRTFVPMIQTVARAPQAARGPVQPSPPGAFRSRRGPAGPVRPWCGPEGMRHARLPGAG